MEEALDLSSDRILNNNNNNSNEKNRLSFLTYTVLILRFYDTALLSEAEEMPSTGTLQYPKTNYKSAVRKT